MSRLNSRQIPDTVPQYKKVTLTANQIKALAATPIELIEAPGADNVIVPVFVMGYYHAGATPYDVATAGALALMAGTQLFSTFGMGDITTANDPLAEATDQIAFFDCSGVVSDTFAAATDLVNKAIKITNDGVEYTLGDGTLDIVLHYLVIPTA